MRADSSPRQVLIPILAVGLTIPALNYVLLLLTGGSPSTQTWDFAIRVALAPLLWLGYRLARWALGLHLMLAVLGLSLNLVYNPGSGRRAAILATEIALYLAVAGLLFFSRSAREHFAPAGATGERATA
jgi:hypothetical protein